MYWKQTCINCDMIAPQFFFLCLDKLILIGHLFMFISRGKETGTQCYLKVIEYFVLKRQQY